MEKDFDTWNELKQLLHFSNKNIYFREKEIWWVALGRNISLEINGKHELFERPVLIVKKYSKDMCLVLPFSTRIKEPSPWYQFVVDIDGRKSAINITQVRVISTKRLLRKMAIIDSKIYNNILDLFVRQFIDKNKAPRV